MTIEILPEELPVLQKDKSITNDFKAQDLIAVKPEFSARDLIDSSEKINAPIISVKALTEEAFYSSQMQMVLDPEADPTSGFSFYNKVRTDLITKGTSPEVAKTYQKMADFNTKLDREVVILTMEDPNIPNEIKTEIIKKFMQKGGDFPDLREQYMESLAAKQEAKEQNAGTFEPLNMQFLQDRIDWNREEAALKNGVASQFDPSIVAGLAGLLEIMFPFVDQANVKYLESQITGPESLAGDIGSILFFGENKKALRDTLLAMPFDKRKEATKKLIETISMLPGGDYKKMLYLEAFTGTGEYSTFERVLDDIIGALDATIVLAPVAKLLSRAGKGLLRPHAASALESARVASTDEAVELAMAALGDGSGEVATAIGVSRPEIAAQYILPKLSGEVLKELTPELLRKAEEIEVLHKEVATQLETAGINYTKAEKELAINNIAKELKNVDGLVYYPASSTLDVSKGGTVAYTDGESLFGTAIYGKTEKRGFSSVKQSLERAEEAGFAKADIKIYEKNPKTGELDEVTDLTKGAESLYGGNFYIGHQFKRAFDSRDATTFGADSVTTTGRWAGSEYYGYLNSRFDNWWAAAAYKAADVGTAVESRLVKLVKKDISKLKRDEKTKLFAALEEGATGEGKVFTVSELKTRGLSDEAINGYYTYRKIQDVMWFQTNRKYLRQLKANNMMRVFGLAEVEGKQFGAPLNIEQAAKVKYVYDAKLGEVKEVTPEYIATMYGEGKQFIKMEESIRYEGGRTTHVLLDKDVITIGKLPSNPLPYLEGYYQRAYKQPYFLDRVPRALTIDGERITDVKVLQDNYGYAHSAGDNKFKLDKKAAELNAIAEAEAKAKGLAEAPYYYRARRAANISDADVQELKMHNSYRNATKGRASERLYGDMDNTFAQIEDPMESLVKNIRTMSKYVSMEDFMASSKQRWVNTYGKASNGVFPSSFDDVAEGILKDVEYKNAKAIHNQLSLMQTASSTTDIRWKDFLFSVSEIFEGGKLEFIATGVKGAAEISPITSTRALGSQLFIALAPLRQFVVQPAQLLQLTAITPKYIASGEFTKELFALAFSRIANGNAELTAKANKAGAKLFKVSEEEYLKIVDQYVNKSGLPFSVDGHVLVDGIIKDVHKSHLDSTAKKIMEGAATPWRSLVSVGKKVGFDVGEYINLTGSWLVARKRLQTANPNLASRWSEKQFSDVIDADARTISYGMTQPGIFKYQQGLLSIPLQFMSVPHKALLSVLPETMGGSKFYTKQEKGKLLLANLLLFGAEGWGVKSALEWYFEESGVELDTDTQTLISGGLIDIAFNSLLRTMSNDDADPTAIKFSDAFAPIPDGVIPGFEILSNLWDGRMSAMAGPSLQAGTKVYDLFSTMQVLTAKPDMTTTDKLIEGMVAVGRLGSGFDAGIKSMIARNGSVLVSKSGEPIVEATYQEAMAKLFGLQTYAEDAVWKVMIDSGDRRKTANKWAKLVHSSYMNNRWVRTGNGRTEFNELVQQWKTLERLVDPDILDLAYVEIMKLENRSQTDLNTSVIGRVIRDGGSSIEARESLRNTVNASTMRQKDKDFINSLYDIGNE